MSNKNLPPLIVILGPTASGKTALSVALVKQFGGYIISADSRLVYKGMDIGTAKPTLEERDGVPHFMIDVAEPDETFTVADYQRMVADILQNERGLPFLVGGTGLYIDAVTQNWDIPKGGVRKEERSAMENMSVRILAKRLSEIDPESAKTIDLNNKRRVIRALEVAEQTGESFVAQQQTQPFPYNVIKIGIAVEREELIKRIDNRVDAMMNAGLLDEAKRLGARYAWDLPAMSGIGYKQLGAYIRGEMNLADAVGRIKIETRQYAKRQMTWFKRDASIHWISTLSGAERLINTRIQKSRNTEVSRDTNELLT